MINRLTCGDSVSEVCHEHVFVAYLHRAGIHVINHSCMRWSCASDVDDHVLQRVLRELSGGMTEEVGQRAVARGAGAKRRPSDFQNWERYE